VKRAKTATWATLPEKVRARYLDGLFNDVIVAENGAKFLREISLAKERTSATRHEEDAFAGRLAIAELRRAARGRAKK
jgi:hypothetical protein